MWSHVSGPCPFDEDGCWTSANFPGNHGYEDDCSLSIDPTWTGVLFVEYMRSTSGDYFLLDGEPGQTGEGQLSVHGMAPRSSIVWSHRSSSGYAYARWKICQVEALPQWTVTEGDTCYIDRHGCFESGAFASQRVHGSCDWSDAQSCTVKMSADWEGSLDVVDASFEDRDSWYYENSEDAFGLLEVNGQPFVFLSVDDVSRAGVQGMMASTFTWSKPGFSCTGVKICPMPSTKLPGPWGEEPWTCTASGDSCTLPFEFKGLNFSACTQQFSDPNDADQDGNLHNGHPHCQSATGLSLCGSLQLRSR